MAAKKKHVSAVPTRQLRQQFKALQREAELLREQRSLLALETQFIAARQRDLKLQEERIGNDGLNFGQFRLRRFLDSLPVLIGYVNAQHRLQFCNERLAGFFARSRTNMVGKLLWQVIGESTYDGLRPLFVQALGGDSVTFEADLVGTSARCFFCTLVPDRATLSRAPDGFFMFLLDITDQKAAEDQVRRVAQERLHLLQRAEEAARLKDRFLATVSHELRTPLTSIVGWAALLNSREIDREQVRLATTSIERNARIQARLVEDLLDVSRIVAGKLTLSIGEVDLLKLLPETIDAWRPRIQEKNIQLHLELPRNLDLIEGDAERIQQILNNLLSNALKFTPSGGRIHVSVHSARADVRITVNDTGKGISADFLPHIFEEFRQEDMSSSRSSGGLGVGLTIVRRLVELHGGAVEAHSDGVGKGATFLVRLPKRQSVHTA